MKITFHMDKAERILAARALGSDKVAQKKFTHEFRRLCDPYVPFLNGPLKDTAIERITQIEYVQPYARRQYYENKGNGLRGKEWDKRMWADKKDELMDTIAKIVGGKAQK